jgi:hypothetical protein
MPERKRCEMQDCRYFAKWRGLHEHKYIHPGNKSWAHVCDGHKAVLLEAHKYPNDTPTRG